MKVPKSPDVKLAERVEALWDRMLQVERALIVMGKEFQGKYMSEAQAKEWGRRANHMSNAMREIRSHVKRYGNEFDREPYFTDPDKDGGT